MTRRLLTRLLLPEQPQRPRGQDEMIRLLKIATGHDEDVAGHIHADELMLQELRAIGGYDKFCDLYESINRWFE